MKIRMITSLVAGWAAATIPVAAFAQTGGPEQYHAQVDAALPTYTNQILMAPPGPDWMPSVGVQRVASAVQDSPPTQIVQDGPRIEARDPADTKVIKIDYARGRIRYLSKPRRFNYVTSPHTAVPQTTASNILAQALGALGVPASEGSQMDVDTMMGRQYDRSSQMEQPAYQRERLITIDRIVNGYPVFDSRIRASISNTGQIARLMVLWPRFQMPTGLVLRPRQAVVEEISQRIFEAQEGAPLELQIGLAYARAGTNHLPVAVVAISEPAPDEVEDTGVIELVPLVAISPDGDLDGAPDTADNCPTVPNPDQRDRDNDAVGDPCDNCKGVVNPDQADANGNGTGDACEVPEGACSLPTGGGCETMPAAHCASAGGAYAGNGTECIPAHHPQEVPPTARFSKGPGTTVSGTYTPACAATDHVIHRGMTPISGALSWTAHHCGLGASGTVSFDPGTPPAGRALYFVIAGRDTIREGSYGHDSAGVERPESSSTGPCDLPQALTSSSCP